MVFIKDLKKLSIKDISLGGGKGAGLGELFKIGVPVPDGFVISAQAFEEFLEKSGINVKLRAIWDRIKIKDIESVGGSSEILRNLILEKEIPKNLKKEILRAFNKLNTKYVAVRSSATCEDSKTDSWAGELETYLNTTRESLLGNIKKCWASLFTPKAIFYRFEKKLDHKPISVAVVVQKMIQSDVAGVCFTVHPVTKDQNQMIIEAVWGLGELLVLGETTPDTYVIAKDGLTILDVNVNPQEKMIIRTKQGTKMRFVIKEKREKQKLRGEQIVALARMCDKIEKHFGFPCDIEWGLEKKRLFILQSRPITSL